MKKPVRDNASELSEIFARLRAASGPALSEGQTACCYALSRGHPLLRALARVLNLIGTGR
jgi:hypothetical protein